MKATLRLEKIGFDQLLRQRRPRRIFDQVKAEALPSVRRFGAGRWVAVPRDHLDYSDANSAGSRGICAVWILEAGHTYQVTARTSWHSQIGYYCRVNCNTGAIERCESPDA